MKAKITNKESFYFGQICECYPFEGGDLQYYTHRCLVKSSSGKHEWTPYQKWEIEINPKENN